MVALLTGLIRLILVLIYKEDGACGDVSNKPSILDMHYMYFSLLICGITFVVVTIISLATKRPHPKYVSLKYYITRKNHITVRFHAEQIY